MRRTLPYILTLVLLLLAAGFYLDRSAKNKPAQEANKHIDADSYGPAPDFAGISKWLNTDRPLSINDLKGKVVLVDFWTYSCINCIRTLPYVTKWYDTYKDQGLVVVGVHTPEFTAEKVTANVEQAIKQYKINYPVAQDNDYRTWNAYNNNSWPAKYLIDQTGAIIDVHIGEGDYTSTEQLIRKTLGLDAGDISNNDSLSPRKAQTPEIYFGLSRLEYFGYNDLPGKTPQNFVIPNRLALHTFALEGTWQFTDETADLTQGPGKIKLHFQGSKVYMVAESTTEQSVTAKVDSYNATTINISSPTLYTVFDSPDYGEHTLEITIPKEGFKAYTFTFGQ